MQSQQHYNPSDPRWADCERKGIPEERESTGREGIPEEREYWKGKDVDLGWRMFILHHASGV